MSTSGLQICTLATMLSKPFNGLIALGPILWPEENLWSVGTDHRLYIWDIDKGHIVHTFERAQREHVSCLVPFSGISHCRNIFF